MYTTCFDRHWSSSGIILKLLVETVMLASHHTFVFFVILRGRRTAQRKKDEYVMGLHIETLEAQNASTVISTNSFKTPDYSACRLVARILQP
jgi:hypothetical protein